MFARHLVAALVAISAIACAGKVIKTAADPAERIPDNWIDLPQFPFVARMVRGKAVLVNRSRHLFDGVGLGCVFEEHGLVRVEPSKLFDSRISDGNWGPDAHVDGLLSMVNIIDVYRRVYKLDVAPCPSGTRTAVVNATLDGTGWKAEGTAWR